MRASAGILLGLTLHCSPAIAADLHSALPGWMSGAWIETRGDVWAEEFWTPPRGGLMIGAARNGKGKALSNWEATRITTGTDGRTAFIAMPNGGPAVSFPLEKSDDGSISFVNPSHDYPQRIRYWREGKELLAEISLLDGSKTIRWRYKPMGQ